MTTAPFSSLPVEAEVPREREAERQRVLAMIAIEEEFGPVVSGGRVRGAVAGSEDAARLLEAKMPRDVSALQAILAQEPRP